MNVWEEFGFQEPGSIRPYEAELTEEELRERLRRKREAIDAAALRHGEDSSV